MLDLGLKVHRITKLKYQSKAFIERHKHEFFHYIYVVGGTGEIEIETQTYKAAERSLYLVPPHTMHEIYCEKDLTTIDIKFICHPSCGEMIATLPRCVTDLNLYEENIVRGLLSEAVAGEMYFEEVINTRFTELMIRMLRRAKGELAGSQPITFEDDTIRDMPSKLNLGKVLAYIEDHIEEPICISDLAQLLGYSESYFCTVFKKVYGISPNKYINQAKINKAKDLMLYSRLNITEIAELLGYEHIHYFSRLFKKFTAASPQIYIKKLNKDIVVNVNRESVFIPQTRYEYPQRLPEAK